MGVQSLDEDKVRSVYYESASIEDILSNDELQSILIFVTNQASIKCVSKIFNELQTKNDILMKRLFERRKLWKWYIDSARMKNTFFKYAPSKTYRLKGPMTAFGLFNSY